MHDVYVWVKFLHHLAAVAWLGWLLLAPVWLSHGLGCGDAARLARLRARVSWLSAACIGGGVAVAWVTGWAMARTLSPDAFELRWLGAGTALSLAVSVFWLAVLLPLYRHLLAQRQRTGTHARGPAHAWRAAAAAAAAAGLAVLWMMTVRPI